ncbi:hypothetical protein DFH09DRAFT_1046695 [Mycena vulgaris]|nr:hypothetical protein DFH09DRAFT_1046695 [Mycena vulgaris]
MSTVPRRILIDDADPAIQYGAGWAPADTSKLDGLGNYGPVHAGTSHATTINGSTLSFKFSGTSIAVFGTINIVDTTGVVTPTWTCLVDGVPISEQNPTFKFPQNNWNLCAQPQLSTGAHTLTINVQTTGRTFYIDYLLYTPTVDVDLDGAVLEYRNTDVSVSFQSGWQTWGAQNVTQSNGASVALNFHGTAVTLIGYIPIELPKNSTGASYAIDGGASTSFTLAGLAQGVTTTVYTLPILQISGLSPAVHTLVVTYNGDSSHTPLPVGVFYVTNTVVAAADPSSSPPSLTSTSFHTSTSTSTFTSGLSATSRRAPISAIVGAIISGLVLLALLAGGIFCCRKRRRRVGALRSGPSALAPFFASDGEAYISSTKNTSTSGARTLSPHTRPSKSLAGDATQNSHATVFQTNTRRTASPYGSLSPPSSSLRDAEHASLAPLRRPVVFQQTVDSGVRIPGHATQLLEPDIVELPPGYSRD